MTATAVSTASPARIAANRANSLKSQGPSSERGRSISRQNSLKHGLTGQGIVLADQDAPEVERRAAALMAELDPRSTLGKMLVGQLATLSVRLERSARQEEEAVAKRVRRAAEAFDHDRVDEVEDLFDSIAEDPRRAARMLKRSPEGVDRLVEAWSELRDNLTRADIPYYWEDSHQAMLAHPPRAPARADEGDPDRRAFEGRPEQNLAARPRVGRPRRAGQAKLGPRPAGRADRRGDRRPERAPQDARPGGDRPRPARGGRRPAVRRVARRVPGPALRCGREPEVLQGAREAQPGRGRGRRTGCAPAGPPVGAATGAGAGPNVRVVGFVLRGGHRRALASRCRPLGMGSSGRIPTAMGSLGGSTAG